MAEQHLAQINVGHALFPLDDPRMHGFMSQLDRINALADRTPGFVWRLQTEAGNATDVKLTEDPAFIVNMSVWTDVDALFGYVYKSDHREVMALRRQWFRRPVGPYQALWWVPARAHPTPQDGLQRVAHLAEHGPSPFAFTFKQVFPPGGSLSQDLAPEPWCVGWA